MQDCPKWAWPSIRTKSHDSGLWENRRNGSSSGDRECLTIVMAGVNAVEIDNSPDIYVGVINEAA
jgi:hypothetical protein